MTIAQPSILRAAHPVRVATSVVFFIAGFAMSAWAPLVPFAKARLAINDASLGLLMLCLGIGSLLAIPLAAPWSHRLGCKRPIIAAACVLGSTLPLLAWLESMPLLAMTLLLFGAGLGTLDITMNIQAMAVEKASGRAMMSGFHGFFSLGGIAGAGLVSALLACALSPLASVLVIVAVLFALLALAAGQLLTLTGEDPSAPLFVRPHGRVLAVGLLCFILFLTEGAMLDWSALFLTHEWGMSSASGGLGYALFCISMTLGRLCGDRLINYIGRFRMLLGGSLCAGAGLLLAIDVPAVTLFSFLLLGFGAANLVPLLLSVVSDQRDMPPHLALAAISGVGYSGILTGPALIGFIAHLTSLYVAFCCVAVLLLVVSACARLVTH
ncbi:MFS transporter [Candidatus Sodalis endolongispinus]|uniref:MFS transporter n=1 Tax=Candidatus Sodalis endolongispinus TaxID=2812662 RepID=A0ABS5Y995_9GAMM|nr:MFS transporter [Candidatus Sodalis endolongispinus]MBT9431544.1 MFS transporter [Candidatus Sodalis endolongispinus]